MQHQLFTPHAPSHRNDPETSREAAASVDRFITGLQSQVLDLLAVRGPMTDETMRERARDWGAQVGWSTLATRRGELVRLGLVEDSGERETLESGRRAVVWQITAAGYLAWEAQQQGSANA